MYESEITIPAFSSLRPRNMWSHKSYQQISSVLPTVSWHEVCQPPTESKNYRYTL